MVPVIVFQCVLGRLCIHQVEFSLEEGFDLMGILDDIVLVEQFVRGGDGDELSVVHLFDGIAGGGDGDIGGDFALEDFQADVSVVLQIFLIGIGGVPRAAGDFLA